MRKRGAYIFRIPGAVTIVDIELTIFPLFGADKVQETVTIHIGKSHTYILPGAVYKKMWESGRDIMLGPGLIAIINIDITISPLFGAQKVHETVAANIHQAHSSVLAC